MPGRRPAVTGARHAGSMHRRSLLGGDHMRPVRLIAALVSAATVGMLTLAAAPAWAAPTTPPVAVHASPNPVVAGHPVTLSGSVGPDAAGSDCSSLILYSDAFSLTDDVTRAPVYTTAKPSGAFTATATIPRAKPAGTYAIYLRCGGATIGASATLLVRAAPPATTTPAASPPASTVTQPPAPTAAPTVAGPATPAAAHPAGRWILPWLAALAASTLAGLGMWLLYQRRHPPSLGREQRPAWHAGRRLRRNGPDGR